MQETSALSQNLRRLRDAQKLSQAELAERAKLSRVAYRNIESGAASPKVDTLLRIADVLDLRHRRDARR
ncbi:MAG TPA: helix-turn-helix transcriptional regulator [Kofleriaceae bacterium]|jgi:transcriptional regulator with XRE-family HTH domain|nr:helix-turn-helix transcriptional regulator [Kofleriaceae bacterium]